MRDVATGELVEAVGSGGDEGIQSFGDGRVGLPILFDVVTQFRLKVKHVAGGFGECGGHVVNSFAESCQVLIDACHMSCCCTGEGGHRAIIFLDVIEDRVQRCLERCGGDVRSD